MEEEIVGKVHILVIPLPFQGHVNPMLQFAKRLASKALRVTFVVAFSTDAAAMEAAHAGTIRFVPVSGAPMEGEKLENMVSWWGDAVPERLPEIIAGEAAAGRPVGCVVYDSGTPWVLDLAKAQGIPRASFFTHSCAVACVYYNANRGRLRIPLAEARVSLPGLPVLEADDLPSFISDPESYPSFLKLVISRFSNVGEADWIFFSSFDSLENEVVSWMRTQWPIKPIGPTIPSMYLDKRLEHDKDYAVAKFTPDADACAKWLDLRETGSVVYVSFGTLANLGKDQMEELAAGLEMSDCDFLWVVRESELEKLPRKFSEETVSKKCLVVNWCRQLEVLSHESIGCFVTHCGWNSVLEAIGLGVPLVAMPQWTDQRTNAKFVADVWRVGVRAKASESGVVKREEIDRCVREVVRGARGREIRGNAVRWKELAKEALSEGGSSDRNIEEFVTELVGKMSL